MATQEEWDSKRKHEIGYAFFVTDLLDDVRRKIFEKLRAVQKARGFGEVEMLLFAREVIYEIARNLVNELEHKLHEKGSDAEPLFPEK